MERLLMIDTELSNRVSKDDGSFVEAIEHNAPLRAPVTRHVDEAIVSLIYLTVDLPVPRST